MNPAKKPMNAPQGWRNPITATPGQVQQNVVAAQLLPSRGDLSAVRLVQQRTLKQSQIARLTPVQVTPDGAIWDGHHAIRVAAESNATVDVLVVPASAPPMGLMILQLPVR